jgi:hypothetical protein
LVWKTAFIAAYTPPLDKIRDQVVQAWKLIEARELVRKRAEQLAELARQDSSQPLRQTLGAQPGIEVIETQPFTWMTQGNVAFDFGAQQPTRLSSVDELSQIGPEFMQKVFSMKVGEIGVAWNHPQSVMYAFQLKELEPSLDVLHARFMSYSFDRYAGAGSETADQIRTGWLFRIMAANGLRWVRPARQPSAR